MDNTLLRIHKSAIKFLQPLNLEDTYALIIKEGNKLLNTQYGSIFLMQNGELKRIWASTPTHLQIKIRKNGNTYKTFRNQKTNVIDIEELEAHHPQYEKFIKLGVKSIVSIPLINHGKSVGVLSLQSTKRTYFTKSQLNILTLFGSLASLAIKKNELYNEIKQALEARDLFISMAAHELRTPLTTISGYSQMLYSKFAGSNTPESRWISDLTWETLRLTHLVNELLEVDRIKKGDLKYSLTECHLRSIVDRAISDFRFTHPNHHVILEDRLIGKHDVFIGNFDKILQMIINLLDNAAKFSPANSEILIRVKSKSGHIYLTIKDRGKGISTKDMDEIFEKFGRGKNNQTEGMGLGLFLVKNIVKQHKGEINIKSKENKGTTVEIELPRAKYAYT